MSVVGGILGVMDTSVVIAAILGLLIGAVIGWLVSANRAMRAAETESDDLLRAVGDARAEAAAALARAETLEEANRVLEQRSADENQILRTLAPVQKTLDRLGQQVSGFEQERAQQFGTLSNQLRAAAEDARNLQRTTAGLESALRSSSARGVWGELELRRVLESSGMLRHVDFAEQKEISTGLRPDVTVHLPGNQHIPIDAKVPLDSHLKAQALVDSPPDDGAAAQDPEMRTTQVAKMRADHAKAVRSHVDALAKRGYHQESGADMTVMFLPAESLLSAALDADPTLLEYSLKKGIVPATPATTLALLRTVAAIWVNSEVQEQAETLHNLGRVLYERLGNVATHLTALGNTLGRSVDAYNKVVGSMESRLLVTAREFTAFTAPEVSQISADKAQVRRFSAPELSENTE